MLTFRDFSNALRKLQIDHSTPVIAHASLSAFGEVHGGVESILGALLSSYNTLIMPAFTYKTMITPEVGPPENAILYGSARDANLMAEFYKHDMPADRMMGAVPEALRQHPKAQRSNHPILSFVGVNAEQALQAQTIEEPLAPIHILKTEGGWVLLLGVDHTVNTSIHYAEWLARRKQFVRWALTPKGVVECAAFPGCSQGFQAIAPRLEGKERRVELDQAFIQAVSLEDLTAVVRTMLEEDPLSLLCQCADCERCNAVRAAVQ
ncbi:MAG: AAC(3) family N-acetyltransferase [Anaerolineales bacterium]|nr:AAC(3) family N-acetyltransferase [Anaerolineales bacterium]